jgi:outer membrane protein assembly factor BamD (BamD/ComL family)
MLKCQLQMGRMAFDKKNWEFAQKYLLRVAMLVPAGEEAAEARYKAGIATFHLGDPDAAIAVWNRLVQAFAGSPWRERLLKELDQYKLRLAPDGKSLEKRP